MAPRPRKWRRRVAGTGAALLGFIFVVLVGAVIFQAHEPIDHVNQAEAFDTPLFIPPILETTTTPGHGGLLGMGAGEQVEPVHLRLTEAQHEYYDGVPSDVMQVNGLPIGPTLRAATGDMFHASVTNVMTEPGTIHWHGMLLPAIMDGGPHQVIEPGTTWSPSWAVEQDAASLWYHAHQHHRTADHVYKGLVGMVIVDDGNNRGLPHDYGANDVPLIIQDRNFDDGRLSYRTEAGFANGDTLLVNGVIGPYFEPDCEPVRFRILNGANAHRFDFAFEDGRSFHVVAADSGFVEHPVRVTSQILSPGERAEILVDFSDCKATRLISRAIQAEVGPITNLGMHAINAAPDENRRFDVLDIRPQGAPRAPSYIPGQLDTYRALDPDDAAAHRTFILGSQSINGKKYDMDRIDFTVQAETIEVWTIHNPSFSYHPFHVHGVHFQVLDRDGRPPPETERAWKDTVLVAPDETVRIIMQTPRYVDAEHPFMFHCHILEHEDRGMMGQFTVTAHQ